MKLTGTVKDLVRDIQSGKLIMSLLTNEKSIDLSGFDGLIDITINKHREKRSLDANAYFHVLVGKIADEFTISKARAKNILICKYGQPLLLDDENICYYKTNAPIEFVQEQEEPHLGFIRILPDGMYMYKVMRGTHTYDTKEMSCLIDGTVADAKEAGIETMAPDEIERMKKAWHP